MKYLKKFLTAIMVFNFVALSNLNVEAADLNSEVQKNFQELRNGIALPVLPDRIRHRNDSHKLQRPEQKRIELPPRKEQPPSKYTQRQPKKPPRISVPSRPTSKIPRRGSEPPKNFGPPRFR